MHTSSPKHKSESLHVALVQPSGEAVLALLQSIPHLHNFASDQGDRKTSETFPVFPYFPSCNRATQCMHNWQYGKRPGEVNQSWYYWREAYATKTKLYTSSVANITSHGGQIDQLPATSGRPASLKTIGILASNIVQRPAMEARNHWYCSHQKVFPTSHSRFPQNCP